MELIISGIALIVAILSFTLFVLSFTSKERLASQFQDNLRNNKKIFTQDGMVASKEQLDGDGPLLLIGDSKVIR
ncbi:hypothetical protein ACOMICROBIO_LKFPLAJE_00356 [Vibrio sp. B1FIG11]|uniref:hypothetical protein n=1 Tax=Vibrio sp. B1FIG11 TaxID=2751177 RepID=UPI0015F6B040|nr:hypothetical protein [Vibrio sp. B1FIG11]CAE6883653.1 hypothetical protein ACOMICROBIO_LKFPLAJE_00356 [Vibrio sp. B1FIG11]